MIHQLYMQRCLDLAKKGLGDVAPNPMVGAVLVYEQRIIGEGWHQKFGGPHAEVNCIKSVVESDKHLIAQSTLYVSLEPCNHFGKTPPCSDLIIANKIKKVIIACKDPFEKVNGSGIQKLIDNGAEVETGILEKEAIELNKRFFTFHQKQRPYIILKWAQSADGFIALPEGKSVKISNEITDKLVHQWRSEEAAIVVGTNTVLNDNPSLTTRSWPGKNPIRIFIDKQLRIGANFKILDNSTRTIIFNLVKNEIDGLNEYLILNEAFSFQENLCNVLFEKNIQSVIIEGGTSLIQSFIDSNCWDEMRVITNEKLQLEQGINSPVQKNQKLKRTEQIGSDIINFYIRY